MSQFFTNYNKINYNIEKQFPITTTNSVNLLNRIKLKDMVRRKLTTFYPYEIKEFERPDTVAYDYYGTVNLTWLILIANDIIDPYYEWPLFGTSLTNFIISKYGSLEQARAGVHHYEKIIRNESKIFIDSDNDFKRILEKTAIIDEETYNELDQSERRIISYYDHEIILNERKRNILLIDKAYSSQIQKEFRILY